MTTSEIIEAEEAKAPKTLLGKRDQQALSALGWWRALQPQASNGKSTPGDRATIAKLRRASSVHDLLVEPATARLFVALRFVTERPRGPDLQRAAVLAGVLATVRDDKSRTYLGREIANPNGSRPVVSAIRLKRFMAAREPEDVLLQFRRIIAMLDNTVSVWDTAKLVLAWLDPTAAGDRARTRFAFQYHGAGLDGPDDIDKAIATDPIITTTEI